MHHFAIINTFIKLNIKMCPNHVSCIFIKIASRCTTSTFKMHKRVRAPSGKLYNMKQIRPSERNLMILEILTLLSLFLDIVV